MGNAIYTFGGKHGDADLMCWDAYDVTTGKWFSTDVEGPVTGPNIVVNTGSAGITKKRGMPAELECLYGQAVSLAKQ
jgi:hypothetical protein